MISSKTVTRVILRNKGYFPSTILSHPKRGGFFCGIKNVLHYLGMKFIIVLSALASLYSSAQKNDGIIYSFINQKLSQDSLFGYRLSENRIEIDTNRLDLTDLLAFYYYQTDTNYNVDWLTSFMFDTSFFYEGLFDNSFWNQIKENNSGKGWDKKKIIEAQTKGKKCKDKSRRWFKLSQPIFFDDGNKALVFIDVIHAELFGRGYFEIYELDTDGKWVQTHQAMTWMS